MKNIDSLKAYSDTVALSIKYNSGSIASISYFSNGNSNLGKERIEIFNSGKIMVLEDFKKITVYSEKALKIKFLDTKIKAMKV